MNITNDIDINLLINEIYNYYIGFKRRGCCSKLFLYEQDYVALYAHLKNEGVIDSYEYLFNGREEQIYCRLLACDIKDLIAYRVSYIQDQYLKHKSLENISVEVLDDALTFCMSQGKMLFRHSLMCRYEKHHIEVRFLGGFTMYVEIKDDGKLLISFNNSYYVYDDLYSAICFCFEEVIKGLANIYKVKYAYA